jgi:outer membrane protein assembly factor BamB
VLRRLVIIGLNGDATTVRFYTGATVARTELRLRLREWEGNYREDYRDDFNEISAVGDALYVVTGHNGAIALTAYDGDSLTVRWRSTAIPPGRVDACGPVICVADLSVFGADPSVAAANRAIVALDPRTGAQRWASRAWQSVAPLPDGRLIATTVGGGHPPRSLIDATTGATIAPLHVDSPLGAAAGGVQRFLHLDDARAQQAWISAVDLATGRSTLIGSIDQVTACEAAGGNLACPVTGGLLAVWRLPA